MDPILDELRRRRRRRHVRRADRADHLQRRSARPPAATASARPPTGARHVREPVRFGPAMAALVEQGHRVFLEIGPHPTLVGHGGARLDRARAAVGALAAPRTAPTTREVATALGRLWTERRRRRLAGVARRRRRPAPSHPADLPDAARALLGRRRRAVGRRPGGAGRRRISTGCSTRSPGPAGPSRRSEAAAAADVDRRGRRPSQAVVDAVRRPSPPPTASTATTSSCPSLDALCGAYVADGLAPARARSAPGDRVTTGVDRRRPRRPARPPPAGAPAARDPGRGRLAAPRRRRLGRGAATSPDPAAAVGRPRRARRTLPGRARPDRPLRRAARRASCAVRSTSLQVLFPGGSAAQMEAHLPRLADGPHVQRARRPGRRPPRSSPVARRPHAPGARGRRRQRRHHRLGARRPRRARRRLHLHRRLAVVHAPGPASATPIVPGSASPRSTHRSTRPGRASPRAATTSSSPPTSCTPRPTSG